MLKYMIIGAGGTGGALGAYLARSGKDVTFIARGAHLKAMREKGLRVVRMRDEFTIQPVKVCDMEHCDVTPDVVFVCVKGYSVDGVIPFIRRIAGPDTVVIPILNVYGTGGRMQKELPGVLVTDGCMYIASQRKEPGVILMSGDILRVVFGVREKKDFRPVLKEIEQDLKESEIRGILSDDIRRDALQKFAYVSPQGACGLYYDIPAGPMQKPGEYRDTFAELVHEIELLAQAQGIPFTGDIVKSNLDILDHVAPDMTTSMQKDIAAGRESEINGLIAEVLRMADEYHVELPMYKKIAEELRQRGVLS